MLCPSLLAADKMLIKFAGTMSNLWIRAFVVFLEAQESASQNQPRVLQQKKQENVDHAQSWSNGQLLQERFGMQAVDRGKHLTMPGWQRQWMDNHKQAFGYVLSFFFGLRTACHTTFSALSALLMFEQVYLPVKCHLISKATSPNISHISWHFTCQRPRHQHYL